jgi:hypothetical protein
MKSHTLISRLQNFKPTIVAAMLLAAFATVCAVGIVSSTAQSTQEEKEERKFENTIPAHVPIKVKVKNEQAFKNLKNKNWARELEIEVKNTGSKPIYFMYMLMVMPDVTVGGYPYALQLHYGRKMLVRLNTPIQPDDVPILPGESVTLTVSETQLSGYEKSRDEEKRNDPKKIEFDMQLINFGDGTGLQGADGSQVPDPARKRSFNVPYASQEPNTSSLAASGQRTSSCYKFIQPSYSLKPAQFMRVNFSLTNFSGMEKVSTSDSLLPLPDVCGCQNAFNCFYGTIDFAT